MSKKSRLWFISTISVSFLFLCMLGAVTAVVDPFFHYHEPLNEVSYVLENERYINDGIVRHFKYDAIITGTSMSECFLSSECDRLFDVNSIKVTYAGAYWGEIDRNLDRAFQSDNNIRLVIKGLDLNAANLDKDMTYPKDDMAHYAPEYLTNNNPFDDVEYFLNKTVLCNNTLYTFLYTLAGGETTTFDVYGNWSDTSKYGGAEVLTHGYSVPEGNNAPKQFTEEDRLRILGNVGQNVTDIVREHPETEFIIFFPPYSIAYWDMICGNGGLDFEVEMQRTIIRELLQYSNIKVYSFYTNYDLICDLNNYRDVNHYGGWVNSDMLHWMANDEYLLTEDNYNEYLDEIANFYGSYDYSYLHELKRSYE